jgi:hypothetical protein
MNTFYMARAWKQCYYMKATEENESRSSHSYMDNIARIVGIRCFSHHSALEIENVNLKIIL